MRIQLEFSRVSLRRVMKPRCGTGIQEAGANANLGCRVKKFSEDKGKSQCVTFYLEKKMVTNVRFPT